MLSEIASLERCNFEIKLYNIKNMYYLHLHLKFQQNRPSRIQRYSMLIVEFAKFQEETVKIFHKILESDNFTVTKFNGSTIA